MPRIAILADIHANLPALEAVADDVRDQEVDEILVGGDLVGRGPQGSAVVDRVRALGWPSVRGNHEDYLINFWRGDIPDEWLDAREWAASRWMADELDAEHVAYLAELPFTMRSRLAPDLHLFHGSPRSNQEGIGPWTEPEALAALAEEIPGDVLACAHTHRPLLRRTQGTLIVNVGSVGLPFNGDWRAQYAILERDASGAWSLDQRQVPYDRESFLRVYETSGFLEHGDITSALLRLEVEQARPFLVPFMKWAEFTDRPPHLGHLGAFLRFYDPELPLRELFEKLDALRDRAIAEEA